MLDVFRDSSMRGGHRRFQMDRSEAMGPRLRGDDVGVSLPRQHTDASVDAAAMIAVGDVADGGGPFECVKLKSRQMRANSNLPAEGIAGRGNFRAGPEPVEYTPAGGAA